MAGGSSGTGSQVPGGDGHSATEVSIVAPLPFFIRSPTPDEAKMVLANWKEDLYHSRIATRWGRDLAARNFWCLANHVVDRITFPSCEIWVGCHDNDPLTPICWAATRRIEGLQSHAIVYLYARQQLREDPELAITLERALLSEVAKRRPLAAERRRFNPYLELDR